MSKYAELKRLAQAVADLEDNTEREDEHAEAVSALWLHMHCHTILGLIADNENGRRTSNHWKDEHIAGNAVINKLEAENGVLLGLLGQSALAATTLRTDAEAYANHSGFNRAFVDLIRAKSGVEVGHGYGSSKYPRQIDVIAAIVNEAKP